MLGVPLRVIANGAADESVTVVLRDDDAVVSNSSGTYGKEESAVAPELPDLLAANISTFVL